jgi:U3 small nucleolar RNA-associated protein 14
MEGTGEPGQHLTTGEKIELVEAIQQGQLGGLEAELPKKGLFAMPFMRRALSKQRQEVALEADGILQALEEISALPEGSAPVQHDKGRAGTAGTAASGRLKLGFGGQSTGGKPVPAEKDAAAALRQCGGSEDDGNEHEDAQAAQERKQNAHVHQVRTTAKQAQGPGTVTGRKAVSRAPRSRVQQNEVQARVVAQSPQERTTADEAACKQV